MQGFSGAAPILVAVSWLPKNPNGTPQETPLVEAVATPEGLVAGVRDVAGILTRWFVPWTSVVYIRQVQTALDSGLGGTDPTPVPPSGSGPPPDPKPRHN